MNQIDLNTVFLIIIFILPGYFTHKVCSFLYKEDNKLKEIEVTYQSLLYSAIIFTFYYALVKVIFKDEPVSYVLVHPVQSILIINSIGLVLGILVFLLKFKLGNLRNLRIFYAEPPNIYAAIFDPDFQETASSGYWIVWWQQGHIREGWVEYTEVKGPEKIIMVKDIRELDEDKNVIHEYPSDYSIIVNVNEIEGFQIFH